MSEPATDEVGAITRLLQNRLQALRAKDAEALTADYAPDLLSFDLPPPLATRGIDPAALKQWLAGWDGPVDGEIRDLNVTVGGDVAFCTSLNRMVAQSKQGKPMDIWVRTTLGLHKQAQRWRIVHEHVSVPFYMDGTERAALDLKP